MHVQRILRENQRVAVALVLKKVNEEVENQNWIAPPVFAEKRRLLAATFIRLYRGQWPRIIIIYFLQIVKIFFCKKIFMIDINICIFR